MCKWQVIPKHAYTIDPTKSEWANYAAVRAQCGSLSGNELTRNSSGNTQPQSSQLAEPLWTDPGLKSVISVRKLISVKKKKKSADRDWMVEHSHKILASEEEATTNGHECFLSECCGWKCFSKSSQVPMKKKGTNIILIWILYSCISKVIFVGCRN